MRLNDISHHDYYGVRLRRMSVHNQKYDNDPLYIRSEPVTESHDLLRILSDSVRSGMNFRFYTKKKFAVSDILKYIEKSYPTNIHDVYGIVKNTYDQSRLLYTISKIDKYMKIIFNTETTLRSLSKECNHYTWKISFSRRR